MKSKLRKESLRVEKWNKKTGSFLIQKSKVYVNRMGGFLAADINAWMKFPAPIRLCNYKLNFSLKDMPGLFVFKNANKMNMLMMGYAVRNK